MLYPAAADVIYTKILQKHTNLTSKSGNWYKKVGLVGKNTVHDFKWKHIFHEYAYNSPMLRPRD